MWVTSDSMADYPVDQKPHGNRGQCLTLSSRKSCKCPKQGLQKPPIHSREAERTDRGALDLMPRAVRPGPSIPGRTWPDTLARDALHINLQGIRAGTQMPRYMAKRQSRMWATGNKPHLPVLQTMQCLIYLGPGQPMDKRVPGKQSRGADRGVLLPLSLSAEAWLPNTGEHHLVGKPSLDSRGAAHSRAWTCGRKKTKKEAGSFQAPLTSCPDGQDDCWVDGNSPPVLGREAWMASPGWRGTMLRMTEQQGLSRDSEPTPASPGGKHLSGNIVHGRPL